MEEHSRQERDPGQREKNFKEQNSTQGTAVCLYQPQPHADLKAKLSPFTKSPGSQQDQDLDPVSAKCEICVFLPSHAASHADITKPKVIEELILTFLQSHTEH